MQVKFVTLENGDEIDFVDLDKTTGLLTLAPGIETQQGVYALKMQIYLEDYPIVIEEQAFTATVLGTDNCLFDQITFGNNIAATTYTFSNPENTLIIDPELIQSVPNCPRMCKFYENTAEI